MICFYDASDPIIPRFDLLIADNTQVEMPIENAPHSASVVPSNDGLPLDDAPEHSVPYLSVRYVQQVRETNDYFLCLAFSPSEPFLPGTQLRVVVFPVKDVPLPRAKKDCKKLDKPTTTAFKYVYSHTDFHTVVGESREVSADSWLQAERQGDNFVFSIPSQNVRFAHQSHLLASISAKDGSNQPLLYTCFIKCTRAVKQEVVRFGLVVGAFGDSPLAPSPRLVALSNLLNLVNNHSKMRQVTHGAFACLLLAQPSGNDISRHQAAHHVLSELEEDGCSVLKSYWNKPGESAATPKEKFEQAVNVKESAIAHSLFIDFPQPQVEQVESFSRYCAKSFKSQISSKEARTAVQKIGVATGDPISPYMPLDHASFAQHSSSAPDSSLEPEEDELQAPTSIFPESDIQQVARTLGFITDGNAPDLL